MQQDPVQAIRVGERVTAIADSIGRCKGAVNTWTCAVPLVWKSPLWEGLAELLTSAAGIGFNSDMIEKIADRICAVERAFNVMQGITIEHDNIPQKIELKNTPEGRKEKNEHFKMVRDYYKAHGYDQRTGIPTRKTLKSLDLEWVAEKLRCRRPYGKWDGPTLWQLNNYPKGPTGNG